MRTSGKRSARALVTVLAGLLLSPCAAQAYSLTTWSWNEPIALKLTDGREIQGRYRGVFGRTSNPDTYRARYEAWRAKLGPETTPALGETLLVKGPHGDPVRGVLRGFADDGLMLVVEDSCICPVLPLNEVTHVEPARERGPDRAAFASPRRWKSAPSLYAVGLEVDRALVAVPVSVLESRAMLPRAGANSTATAITGVLVFAVLLAGMAAAAAASALSQPMI